MSLFSSINPPSWLKHNLQWWTENETANGIASTISVRKSSGVIYCKLKFGKLVITQRGRAQELMVYSADLSWSELERKLWSEDYVTKMNSEEEPVRTWMVLMDCIQIRKSWPLVKQQPGSQPLELNLITFKALSLRTSTFYKTILILSPSMMTSGCHTNCLNLPFSLLISIWQHQIYKQEFTVGIKFTHSCSNVWMFSAFNVKYVNNSITVTPLVENNKKLLITCTHSPKPIRCWSTFPFYWTSSITRHIVTWQFLTTLLCKSAPNLSDEKSLSSEGLFRSTHRCAAGFSSGIWLDHSKTLISSFAGLDVYFGFLSSWKVRFFFLSCFPMEALQLRLISGTPRFPPPWLRPLFQVKNSPKAWCLCHHTPLWLLRIMCIVVFEF